MVYYQFTSKYQIQLKVKEFYFVSDSIYYKEFLSKNTNITNFFFLPKNLSADQAQSLT